MATVEETSPPEKGPSLIIQLAVLLGLTVAAVGAGWLTGQYLTATQSAPALTSQPARGEEGEAPAAADGILPLQPVTTNLAGPGETWVRMELALVFEDETDAAIAEFVHQDIMAYLRTVTLSQIEGASGFQHLKSDLEERAQIRTGGKVKSILIRTLLFE